MITEQCFVGAKTVKLLTQPFKQTWKLSQTRCFHTPVLLNEVLQNLTVSDGDLFLDMTFGAGGHCEAILKSNPNCRVVALDRDPHAFSLAQHMAEKYRGRLTPLLGRFSDLHELLLGTGFKTCQFTAALLDAGCSSMQFDDGHRGFSISHNGPLDMRMDGQRLPDQPSAADVVNTLDEEDLALILEKYGDERLSKKIACSLVENRPIYTTKDLAEAVGNAFSYSEHMLGSDAVGRRRHAATKTFMALRIFVNDEINELHKGIVAAGEYLCDGGSLAVITFNPIEDRLVKRTFNEIDFAKPFNLSLRQSAGLNIPTSKPTKSWTIFKTLFRPSPEEININPRSRSAKLRIAIKNNE